MGDSVDRELLDEHLVKELQTAFDAEEPGSFLVLIADFVNTGEDGLRSIETAASNGDWDEVRQVAHRLKGMSSQLGARALRHQSSLLEQELKEPPTSRRLRDRICAMWDVLERTAKAYHELVAYADQR
jgi:HPt (histidine-containing phosphotransfer) domain-containing protein